MRNTRRLAAVCVLAVTASGLGGAQAGTGRPGAEPFGNAVTQVLPTAFADPGAYVDGAGTLHLYATGFQGARGTAFNSTRRLAEGGFSEPQPAMSELPAWVGPRGVPQARGETHMWAPHVWRQSVSGSRRFVMYFSASKRGGTDCIGRAVADSPRGPFRPDPLPLRCPPASATLIDPAYVQYKGQSFLLYKRRVYRPGNTAIWAVRVRADGSRAQRAQPFRLVSGGQVSIEAPYVVQRAGRMYLFVSRQSYDSCRYHTQVFVSGGIRGRFADLGRLPIRKRDGRFFCGPGGAEVVQSDRGWEIAFHVFNANPQNTASDSDPRYTWLGRLRWGQGKPYLTRS